MSLVLHSVMYTFIVQLLFFNEILKFLPFIVPDSKVTSERFLKNQSVSLPRVLLAYWFNIDTSYGKDNDLVRFPLLHSFLSCMCYLIHFLFKAGSERNKTQMKNSHLKVRKPLGDLMSNFNRRTDVNVTRNGYYR